MNDRSPNADHVRVAILNAATTLFSERGFHRTSIDAVARTAGVTKSLIHHHIGNKRDLWTAVIRQALGDYLKAQHRLLVHRNADGDLFEHSLRMYFDYLRAHPEVIRLEMWMRLEFDQSFEHDIDMEGVAELSMLRLAHGQSEGRIRDNVSPFFMMSLFWTLTEQWFHSRDAYVARFDPGLDTNTLDQTYIDTVVKVLLEGLHMQTTPEQKPPD